MASPEVQTPSEPDWTDQVTDLVVDVVGQVRDKTTGPVLKGARGVVYGTVILFVAIFVVVSTLVLGGRVIALLPWAEWISYLIVGILFNVVGFFLWSKRYAKS